MFEWILGLIVSGGYVGLLALMFLENLFPPIPSELVMPLAGFLAARGEMDALLVVVIGTAGSVSGALPWYWLGRHVNKPRLLHLAERHGHWLTVDTDEVEAAYRWFRHKGWRAVLFGRLMPGIRTLISIPAGMAGMRLSWFLALTTAGSLLWTGFLTGAGFLLENQYQRVHAYLDPLSWVVFGLILAIYLWRVGRKIRPRD